MGKRVKKNRIYLNAFFNVIALVAVIIMLVFCFYLFKLDMIPFKYLSILYGVIGVIFLILLGLTLPRKIKFKVKTVCLIFFLLFSTIFVLGIKYVDKTIEFLDVINTELSQKEEYHLSVLESSIVESGGELSGKKVGLYTTSEDTRESIMKVANKELTLEFVDYDDVILMFEDLQEKKIDSVIVNSSIESLLDADLSYMNLKLRNVYTLMVPIKETDIVKVVDVTNTPFNIYIAGGDAYGSINKVTNTDVNMVVSVDPVNHKLLLTSIPRDYYVVLPSKGEDAYDKLTHAGYYGIGESVKAVENLLDIEINYYVKVNFSTIEGVIDAIGGVDVDNKKSFCTYYDPTNCYKKGKIHLTGQRALYFARERRVFNDGDVQRVKNQQLVLSAIIDKFTSSTALITEYTDILDSVKKNFATNMDTKSINRLVKMQLNDMRGWTIESQNLVGTSASEKTFTFPKMKLYVMKQNEESISNAITKINDFFGG